MIMYKYKCLNPIARVGLDRFSADYVATDNIDEAEAVLVRSADMHNVKLSGSVLAVGRAGAGVNNIPINDYAEQGVIVFNTPGANANGVKEMVFAGMLLAARDIHEGINWVSAQVDNPEVAKQTEKEKKNFAGSELSGKTLGVIGLGAIGVLVANAATNLGMEVYGYDPYISVDAAWSLSRSIKHINDINKIYRECDYITIHVPLNDGTRGMVGKEQIMMMKDSAVLLNFARDLLVDEEAVVEALREGHLHRYVSDFPNPVTVGKKGVILSPHLGASTEESEDNCAKAAVRQIRDFIENGNIKNSVNYPACHMGVCQSAARVAICHRNVKQMIVKFTGVFSDTNIENMSNTSRGEYAYTMLDVADDVTDEQIEQIRAMDGVLRVRVIRPGVVA